MFLTPTIIFNILILKYENVTLITKSFIFQWKLLVFINLVTKYSDHLYCCTCFHDYIYYTNDPYIGYEVDISI